MKKEVDYSEIEKDYDAFSDMLKEANDLYIL